MAKPTLPSRIFGNFLTSFFNPKGKILGLRIRIRFEHDFISEDSICLRVLNGFLRVQGWSMNFALLCRIVEESIKQSQLPGAKPVPTPESRKSKTAESKRDEL